MKRSFQIGLATLGTAVLVAIPVATASALTASQTSSERCTIAENRIAKLLSNLQATGQRREAAYDAMVSKTQTNLAKLQAAGYETTKLTTDLQTVNQDILAYHGDSATFYQDLQATQNFACGSSQGQFMDALLTARQQLPVVRMAADKVHADFRSLVVPDLKDASTWLRQHKSTK